MTSILFLCTGNSCRSQMAEGWARKLKSGAIKAFSAGVVSHGLNPLAVRAMAEAGVDISGYASTTLEELGVRDFDYVITLCDDAAANCPVFPAKVKLVHHPFDDPPRLAKSATNEEEAMTHYRRVRDEIRDFVAGLPGSLEAPAQ